MKATDLLRLRVAGATAFRHGLQGQQDYSDGAQNTVVLSQEQFLDLIINYNVREADYSLSDLIYDEGGVRSYDKD